jgi:hypothetical protein
LVVGIVLDADTGEILSGGAAKTTRRALEDILRSALAKADEPAHLFCKQGAAAALKAAAKVVGLKSQVLATELPVEAEEIMDTMLGDLAGYQASPDPASPATWRALVAATLDFWHAAPWIRVPDTVSLPMQLELGGRPARYRAVVLGQAAVEHGMWMVPYGSASISELGLGTEIPAGSLGITMIPSRELPIAGRRARRFGWPANLEPVPMFFCSHGSSGGEPSQEQTEHLILALAAIQAFDRADHLARLQGSIRGAFRLPEGRMGRFRLAPAEDISDPEPPTDPWSRPPDPGPVNLDLRSEPVRDDLLPEGTQVRLGPVAWELVAGLRQQAELHLDSPVPQKRSDSGLTILALECRASSGAKLARRLLEAEPMGLITVEDEGELLLALLCRDGVYGITSMPAQAPETVRFKSQMAASGGDHAVLVATFDGPAPRRILGFFECHLQSAPPRSHVRPGSRRPRPRKRHR